MLTEGILDTYQEGGILYAEWRQSMLKQISFTDFLSFGPGTHVVELRPLRLQPRVQSQSSQYPAVLRPKWKTKDSRFHLLERQGFEVSWIRPTGTGVVRLEEVLDAVPIKRPMLSPRFWGRRLRVDSFIFPMVSSLIRILRNPNLVQCLKLVRYDSAPLTQGHFGRVNIKTLEHLP